MRVEYIYKYIMLLSRQITCIYYKTDQNEIFTELNTDFIWKSENKNNDSQRINSPHTMLSKNLFKTPTFLTDILK